MRARSGGPVDAFPHRLMVFDGREFTTSDEWMAAFDVWCEAREVWEAAHPGVVLPERMLSQCPWDDELPHSGVWSRPDGGEGVRCVEHDLRPDEH
jgi:hypothetical protein